MIAIRHRIQAAMMTIPYPRPNSGKANAILLSLSPVIKARTITRPYMTAKLRQEHFSSSFSNLKNFIVCVPP